MIKLKSLISEENTNLKDITVGDLKLLVDKIAKKEKLQDIVKLGGAVGKLAASFLPVPGIVTDLLDVVDKVGEMKEMGKLFSKVFLKAKTMPDEKTKDTILSIFDIDDNYGWMLDDAVQKEFSDYLTSKIFASLKVKDTDKIAEIINANVALEQWLAKKFNNRTLMTKQGGIDIRKAFKKGAI